jgi:hypothetical protein
LRGKRIEKILAALQKNNMQGFFVKTGAEAAALAESLLTPGSVVTVGGSVTLRETGIIDILASGRYEYLDRYDPALSQDELKALFRRSFSADSYLCSVNAITESGELYQVDGNGNRVAALLYGPEQVIVVAGRNKIVTDLSGAVHRVKQTAAPANSARLNCNTPCVETGECVSLRKEAHPEMTGGCQNARRICSNYVIMARQQIKDRIKVILVGEDLGY